MTVEESQRVLMKEFEMKLMPTANEVTPMAPIQFRPLEHDRTEIKNWQWQHYPTLHMMDLKSRFKE
jgi:hypothetical protein